MYGFRIEFGSREETQGCLRVWGPNNRKDNLPLFIQLGLASGNADLQRSHEFSLEHNVFRQPNGSDVKADGESRICERCRS